MEDARSKRSLCNDRFAERFMDEEAMKVFAPFKTEAMPNTSNIVRCRIIDDFVRGEVERDDNVVVVSIGAGFDTRPYRITGGRWVEVDELQIIEYKNQRLPAKECSNPLLRIDIDFSQEVLSAKLSAEDLGSTVIVVMEGVFMYLDKRSIIGTLGQLQELYPAHTLLCDLMTQRFFDRFAQSIHSKLVSAGAGFAARSPDPIRLFKDNGYDETERTAMFRRAAELGVLWERHKIPRFVSRLLLDVFMKDLNGYAAHRLVFPGPQSVRPQRKT